MLIEGDLGIDYIEIPIESYNNKSQFETIVNDLVQKYAYELFVENGFVDKNSENEDVFKIPYKVTRITLHIYEYNNGKFNKTRTVYKSYGNNFEQPQVIKEIEAIKRSYNVLHKTEDIVKIECPIESDCTLYLLSKNYEQGAFIEFIDFLEAK